MISIILLITGNKSIDSFEAKSKKDKKPNIIFILSDDHTTNAISAYGSIYKEIAPTPNIDRIADEGILFTNASVTNSICAPSRAVILTGKHSHISNYIWCNY